MADPLTAAAESLAPSRAGTNFFDPEAGAGVLSRYAAAAQAAPAADRLAEAQSRLASSRMEQAAFRRRMAAWDREDQEYEAKQRYKVQRGQFLRALGGLDPEDPDYLAKRAETYASIPMEAKDDDAAAAIIAASDHRFNSMQAEQDRVEREQRAQTEYDRKFQMQQDAMRDRARASRSWEVFKKGAPADTYADLVDDYGDIKPGMEAEAARRAMDYQRQTKVRDEQAKAELKALTPALSQRTKTLINDPRLFPSRVSQLIKSTKKNLDLLKFDNPYELEDARNQDADKLATVTRDALAMDEEAFTALAQNDTDRDLMKSIWQEVRTKWGARKPAAPAPPPPSAPGPAAPPQAQSPAAPSREADAQTAIAEYLKKYTIPPAPRK